jgi:alkylated DNA repair dioxygenase AlkB
MAANDGPTCDPNCYVHYENWIGETLKQDPQEVYDAIMDEVEFTQGQVMVWGKLHNESRLTSMHVAKKGMKYSYSGTTKDAKLFTPTLRKIAKKIKSEFEIEVDMCLANWYRDGNDSIGVHSDDEKDMSLESGGPHIFSISLGATRKFRFRRKGETKGWCAEFNLRSGDMVHMHGKCQEKYVHMVPKEKKVKEGRINLTFRVAAKDKEGNQIIRSPARKSQPRSPKPKSPKPKGDKYDQMTRTQLYEEAKRLEIPGRSKMKVAELRNAVREADK